MARYQPVLVDQGDIQLSVASILNLAVLLPAKIWEIQYDCMSIILTPAELTKDKTIANEDLEYFTGGSSFMENGQNTCKVGYVVVTLWDTVEIKTS